MLDVINLLILQNIENIYPFNAKQAYINILCVRALNFNTKTLFGKYRNSELIKS